jgi:hypothetical protein
VNLAEIIPGTLWCAAGWLHGARATWLPEALPDHLPVNCYVLRDGAEWLAVDTGLPVHWAVLQPALAATLGGTRRRRMLNTRREQDCMANLPAMVRALGITEVPYVGVLNPLELTGMLEEEEIRQRIAAMALVRAVRLAVGEVLEVGRLRIEPLRTLLRLLATNWFHEHTTGTLFTSDAFAWLVRAAPDALVRGAEPMRPADLAHMMSAKFDWLIGIDPSPILADVDALFATRRIARICPGWGLVIEGEAAVREAHACLRDAITLLAARRPVPWTMPKEIA